MGDVQTFFDSAAPEITRHFGGRTGVLDRLISFATTGEEWFRIELLSVFAQLAGVEVRATNQRGRETRARPDFTLSLAGRERLVELKVLPRDRNYASGWQRFLAGTNNKKDFTHLADGERHGIIYVYWPDEEGWQACRQNLEAKYRVRCSIERQIQCQRGIVVFSFWLPQ